LWGEWQQKFDFPPVSYSNQSQRKREFKERVRGELTNEFVFFGEVKLDITLYLEEQKLLETPEYGDLDNYAKSICDAIKGKGGLLIDDCQIQSLAISWIDVPGNSYFEFRYPTELLF
jgi:Holliday junction resolvase RusA-like endonuclease